MKGFIAAGATGALLSVMLGALATHGLKDQLTAEALAAFTTAAQYQMYHSLALLLVCALPLHSRWVRVAKTCFVIGTLLFSGSIYGLTLAQWTWLGPVTPLGGLTLMLGWLALIVASLGDTSNG